MLEKFFRLICLQLNDNEALNTCPSFVGLPKDLRGQLRKGLRTRMTNVNLALENAPFQRDVWAALGLKSDIVFPQLPGTLIFGDVSAAIHLPGLAKVYVSCDAPEGTKPFFEEIARLLATSQEVEEYDEGMAALGDEMHGNL